MTRRIAHLAVGVVAVSSVLLSGTKALASPPIQVKAGYDLLQTDPSATTFPGLGNLMGVPLGSYDFGGTVGVVNTGQTDTIVQRLADANSATLPGTAPTISDQLDALQLETISPVNFSGFGLDNYFLTLQSVHGGPLSTGTMDISFADANGGTFDSSLDVFYDIRKGSLAGPIVGASSAVISATGSAWSHNAPPGAILIDSINNILNGVGTGSDFWPGNPLAESGGGFTDTLDASLPEPTSAAVVLCIAAPLLLKRRRASSPVTMP